MYPTPSPTASSLSAAAVLRVGIVQIAPSAGAAAAVKSDLAARVERALSSSSESHSQKVSIVSSQVYSDPMDRFYSSVLVDSRKKLQLRSEDDDWDILIIACLTTVPGSFRNHVKLSTLLRQQHLIKLADAMALQVRRNAAAQDPVAALCETVIGYYPVPRDAQTTTKGGGFLVILLPENGLDQGLGSVRGLLQHALRTARADDDDQNLPHGS